MRTLTGARRTASLAATALLATLCGCAAIQEKLECGDLALQIQGAVGKVGSAEQDLRGSQRAAQELVDDLNAQAEGMSSETLKRSVRNFGREYQGLVDYLAQVQRDPVAAGRTDIRARMDRLNAAATDLARTCAG
jgi:hypothetical protein